jgi:hypothetical protein
MPHRAVYPHSKMALAVVSNSRAKTAAVRRLADAAAAIAVPGRPSAFKMASALVSSTRAKRTGSASNWLREPSALGRPSGQPASRLESRAHWAAHPYAKRFPTANTCRSFLNKKAAFFRKKNSILLRIVEFQGEFFGSFGKFIKFSVWP